MQSSIQSISIGIIILLITIIFLIAGILRIYSLRKTKGVPTVSTLKHHKKLLRKSLILKESDSLVDLGCGNGNTLQRISQNRKINKLTGVDINRVAIHRGKLILWKRKNKSVQLNYQNIFDTNIQEYTHIYCYLLPSILNAIEQKIINEATPGTQIIVVAFPLPTMIPTHTIQQSGKDIIFYYTV